MPAHSRFTEELELCPTKAFLGKCYRVVTLEDFLDPPSPRLLFDLGPKIGRGGLRFSPPGNHRGLYVATSLQAAGAEYAGSSLAWKTGACAKHITFDISVSLASVLDLTDAGTRRILRTSKTEMLSPWKGYAALNAGAWPATWLLGQAAFTSGRFDGIHFLSNRHPTGTCLLIFTERLVAGISHVSIRKQDGSVWERLP